MGLIGWLDCGDNGGQPFSFIMYWDTGRYNRTCIGLQGTVLISEGDVLVRKSALNQVKNNAGKIVLTVDTNSCTLLYGSKGSTY